MVDRVVQRRQTPDPATYIGKGKADELRDAAEAADCDTVVFDDELSPAQQRNLEKILGRTAIDRTAVILDIFGQNASSQEGKAQVELAQLRYRLPRLRRGQEPRRCPSSAVAARARFGGGETKLEVDRRRIVRRIHKLEAELRDVASHRETQRKQAKPQPAPRASPSSATRTPASPPSSTGSPTRACSSRTGSSPPSTPPPAASSCPGGEAVLLTDTVGFVRKLPHQLVEAFRSTLQVAADADLLVHVVDASAADPIAQMHAVRDVLVEIGAADVPELLCFNKADTAPEAKRLVDRHPGSVRVSALTGEGIEDLLIAVGDRLRAQTDLVELHVPYARGDVLAEVHREGEVLSETAGRRRRDRPGPPRPGRGRPTAGLGEPERIGSRPCRSPVLIHLASLRPESALAIAQLSTVAPSDVLSMATVVEILETVEHTPGCVGLLPVEDSFEGEHTAVLDRLIFETSKVYISEEVVVSERLDAFRVRTDARRGSAGRRVRTPRRSSTATGSSASTASPPASPGRPPTPAAWSPSPATRRSSPSRPPRRPSATGSPG